MLSGMVMTAQQNSSVVINQGGGPPTITDSVTFTGGISTWTVPCGVTSINISAYGAQGGNGATGGNNATGGFGGLGGTVTATMNVTPGQILNIFVGGAGAQGIGGFNGGGNGGSQNAGGGGGATDIRINGTALTDRVLVAGGGGGGGRAGCEQVQVAGGNGGLGGNGAGANGTDAPTPGGVAGGGFGAPGLNGGAAGIGCGGFLGAPGNNGTLGQGGNGGNGQSCCCFSFASIPGGGGGGGGFDGGGGGGGGSAGTTGCSGNDKGAGGGGAGGSNYGAVTLSNYNQLTASRAGNGAVYISYLTPTPGLTTTAYSSTTFCAGDQFTVDAADSYGNATSFQWAVTGDLSLLSGQGTGTVTITMGTNGGDIIVYGENSCGQGIADTVTFTGLALPVVTATAADSAVCLGDSTVLTAGGAFTYVWSPINSNSAITSITPSVSGTYSVTGTDVNGCVNTASVNVNVNLLPTVIASAMLPAICDGNSDTLMASGANSYSWSSGGSSAIEVVMPTSTSTYTVIGTDVNGCSNTAAVTVIVNPLPTVALSTLSPVCVNDGIFALSQGSPVGGVYSGPGVGSGNFSPALAGIGTHVITYTYTDSAGCANSATQNIAVDACTGITEFNVGNILVANPNPATDLLTLSWNSTLRVAVIEVLDVQGRIVNTISNPTTSSVNIDVVSLPAGVYTIRVIDNVNKVTPQTTFIKK